MSENDKNDKKSDVDTGKGSDRTIEIIHRFEKGKGFEGKVPEGIVPPVNNPEDKTGKTDKTDKTNKTDNTDDVEGDDDISLEDLKKQLDAEKKKREDYEQIIALQAEKDFKNEKAAILAKIPEEKRESIEKMIGDDPEVLEDVKRDLLLRDVFVPAAPPANTGDGKGGDNAGEGDGKGGEQTDAEKFDTELDEFLAQVEDDDKRTELAEKFTYKPDDAQSLAIAKEKLNDAKVMTSILTNAIQAGGGRITGKKAPAGKATLPTNNLPDNANDFKAYVDTLYATLRDPTKTEEEKASVSGMLDQLFGEMVKGLRVAKGKYGHAVASYQVMECPNCHALLTGETGEEIDNCQLCGWTKYIKGARRG